MKVLDFAKKIQLSEGGSKIVITAAAILHDIGIKKGEELYNSSAPKYQEIFRPQMAKEILDKIGGISQEEKIHICKIIGSHHSAKGIDTTEFRIIWDVDWIGNLPEEFPDKSNDGLIAIINKIFKTNSGKNIVLSRLTNCL